jgi:hypothetical protein
MAWAASTGPVQLRLACGMGERGLWDGVGVCGGGTVTVTRGRAPLIGAAAKRAPPDPQQVYKQQPFLGLCILVFAPSFCLGGERHTRNDLQLSADPAPLVFSNGATQGGGSAETCAQHLPYVHGMMCTRGRASSQGPFAWPVRGPTQQSMTSRGALSEAPRLDSTAQAVGLCTEQLLLKSCWWRSLGPHLVVSVRQGRSGAFQVPVGRFKFQWGVSSSRFVRARRVFLQWPMARTTTTEHDIYTRDIFRGPDFQRTHFTGCRAVHTQSSSR